jgi:hypothetical protein
MWCTFIDFVCLAAYFQIFLNFLNFFGQADTFLLCTASCIVARNGEKICCSGENTIAYCVLSPSF